MFKQRTSMTSEDFNLLDDHQKIELIFDANKITEKRDDEVKYQLFQIDNFFVEAKTSLQGLFKRIITTYSLKQLPVEYASEVLSIPLVLSTSEMEVDEPISAKRRIA